jgi:hypothetical protein
MFLLLILPKGTQDYHFFEEATLEYKIIPMIIREGDQLSTQNQSRSPQGQIDSCCVSNKIRL